MEGKNMDKYHFPMERYQMHDLLNIGGKHRTNMRIGFAYQHEKNEIKETKKRSLSFY